VLRSVVSDTLGKRPRPSDGMQVGEDQPDVAVGPTQWPVKATRLGCQPWLAIQTGRARHGGS
jgi:hypothetical protein